MALEPNPGSELRSLSETLRWSAVSSKDLAATCLGSRVVCSQKEFTRQSESNSLRERYLPDDFERWTKIWSCSAIKTAEDGRVYWAFTQDGRASIVT